MPQKLFKSGSGLALIIPREMARRYRLSPGSLVEVGAMEEGLMVRPVEVVPRLGSEWSQALDRMVQKYRPALERLNE